MSDRGFYYDLFTPQERRLLAKRAASHAGGSPASLEDERQLLRVLILRSARRLQLEELDREQLSAFEKILGAVSRLALLERLQSGSGLVDGGRADEDPLSRALGEIADELGLK